MVEASYPDGTSEPTTHDRLDVVTRYVRFHGGDDDAVWHDDLPAGGRRPGAAGRGPPPHRSDRPLGATERLRVHRTSTLLPAQAPANEVPAGFAVANDYLHWYNTFYWDKQAMAVAPGAVESAVITNWLQGTAQAYGHAQSRHVPHSVKRPLESRVWYRYPDQPPSHHAMGRGTAPSMTGRVLEGGVSQVTAATYNAQGQVTSRTDALGRVTTSTYAANGLDLLEVRQARTGGGSDVVQSYGSYANHQPGTATDAAGRRRRSPTMPAGRC